MTIARRQRPFRKKLFFPAGMLALLMIPLLGCSLFFSDVVFQKQYCIQVHFMRDHAAVPAHPDTTFIIGESADTRKQQIATVGNYASRLRIASKQDKIIHIVLYEQAQWKDFIALQSFFRKEKFANYAVKQNEIWVHTKNDVLVVKGTKESFIREQLRSCVGPTPGYRCAMGYSNNYSFAQLAITPLTQRFNSVPGWTLGALLLLLFLQNLLLIRNRR